MSFARVNVNHAGMTSGLIALLLAWVAASPCRSADLPPLTHGLTPIVEPKPAPALRLADIDGKVHDLADLKGKLVVVNFWATWCPPCRREMPSLERLRQRLEKQEVVILAVDVGEDIDTIFAFTGQLEPSPNFPILLDRDSEAMQRWKVKGLPSTFVAAPDGTLVFRAVGGREFDHPQLIDQFLKLTINAGRQANQ